MSKKISKLTVYQSQIHIVTYKTCNLYEVTRLAFGNGHQYYTVSCQVAYGLSGRHGSHDLSYSYSMNCMRKMAIFLPITAHLNTGSQYIWPTEENYCSLFPQHQLKNAQMLHSDIINWGKSILLLQKKHMMTKVSGCHTGFCAGGGKHWCT